MVDGRGEVLHGPLAKFVHPEHKVIHVGDAVDIVLEDVDAEGVVEVCRGETFRLSFSKTSSF